MDKLKPCPYCQGNDSELVGRIQDEDYSPGEGWARKCIMCLSWGPLRQSKSAATRAWNTRKEK